MPPVASLSTSAPTNSPDESDLTLPVSALRKAAEDLEAAPQLATAVSLIDLRRSTAELIAKLNRKDRNAPVLTDVLELVRRLNQAGALDLPLSDQDRSLLASWEALGWPGLVAAMLLTSAWRWSSAPALSHVPDWLWADYTEWLFSNPNPLITEDDCVRYAAHLARHTEELARWTERNIAAGPVQAALEAFGRCNPFVALRFAGANARPALEARARILARLHARGDTGFEPFMGPRAGRALRIGFVARQWDLDVDTCAALAKFEQLPEDRVERVLFSTLDPISAFGWHCRDKAREFHLLTGDLAGQVAQLREANLDVVAFIGDTTANDDFSRLALHRVAALQVMLDESGATSGMPEADLRLVSAAADVAREAFSERLARIPAGASAVALRRGGDSELAYAREDLGFAADTTILVAVLPSVHNLATTLERAAEILQAAPATRLVLHVLPQAGLSTVALERFCAVVQAVLAQFDVGADRLSILAPEQTTHDESRAIVRLADIFLAAPGAALWSAEALSAGIPVVALGGREGEWLAAEDLSELVADSGDRFVAAVVALANDPARRAEIKQQLVNDTRSGLACADALASADGFLGIVESAYDQLEANGRAKFKRSNAILVSGTDDDAAAAAATAQAALDAGDPFTAVEHAQKALSVRPADAQLRALYGRALQLEGRADRASVYLLAAIETLNDDAGLWYALAVSFRNEGKNGEATQALESSLRLDEKRPDAWLMLIELAEAAGAFDLAQEAYGALKQAAPDHPQLADLALRFES